MPSRLPGPDYPSRRHTPVLGCGSRYLSRNSGGVLREPNAPPTLGDLPSVVVRNRRFLVRRSWMCSRPGTAMGPDMFRVGTQEATCPTPPLLSPGHQLAEARREESPA